MSCFYPNCPQLYGGCGMGCGDRMRRRKKQKTAQQIAFECELDRIVDESVERLAPKIRALVQTLADDEEVRNSDG